MSGQWKKKGKILVADDSEINRSILTDLLGDTFEILEAEDGSQGMEQLQRWGDQVVLALIDLTMPVMGGVQMMEAMEDRGWMEKIPVLVMFADGIPDDLTRAYELGAVDCIQRPFDAPIVRRRVENTIRSYATWNQAMRAASISQGAQTVSDRTLRLLEYERTKYRFFASMSREVQFEYRYDTNVLTFTEWAADYLGVEEIQVHPQSNPVLNQLLGAENLQELIEKLRNTTWVAPVVEHSCAVGIRGERRWGRVIARSMWDGDNPPRRNGVIGKFVDTHEEHRRIEALEQIVAHDSLTGLLTRDAARSKIESLLEENRGTNYALAVVDLDLFKEANDQYGHLFGDQVLKYVADKLAKSIRSSDLAARVGGDEFLVFMEYREQVYVQTERIFRALSGVFEGFPITVSMGIARSQNGKGGYDVLFRRADQALYAAKRNGRNRYCFYDDSMREMLSVLSPIESDGDSNRD